jgi:probable rRNA maturation factor
VSPRHITVLNESGIDCDAASLADLAGYLLGELRLHQDCELGITLVDVDRMTTLHEDWMQEPGPTDVLSFPIDEVRSAAEGQEPEPGILGDIVLCPAFAQAQAQAAGRT